MINIFDDTLFLINTCHNNSCIKVLRHWLPLYVFIHLPFLLRDIDVLRAVHKKLAKREWPMELISRSPRSGRMPIWEQHREKSNEWSRRGSTPADFSSCSTFFQLLESSACNFLDQYVYVSIQHLFILTIRIFFISSQQSLISIAIIIFTSYFDILKFQQRIDIF